MDMELTVLSSASTSAANMCLATDASEKYLAIANSRRDILLMDLATLQTVRHVSKVLNEISANYTLIDFSRKNKCIM